MIRALDSDSDSNRGHQVQWRPVSSCCADVGESAATAEAETGRPLAAHAPGCEWGGEGRGGEPRRAVVGLGLSRRPCSCAAFANLSRRV